jgi:uncharacterized protein
MLYMKNLYIKKKIFIAAGWFLIAIGTIGIFVPILPTTIFFILATGCFARSSEKFYNWLIYHRFFGKIIRDYRKHKGMSPQIKVTTISLLLLSIGLSAVFFTDSFYIRLLLTTIAIGVSAHIILLRTIKQSKSLLEE